MPEKQFRKQDRYLPLGYGRLAGGTREAEVDYIRSLMTTEMVRAEQAARTAAALPQPRKSIVGRLKAAVRRRLTLFWLKRRDSYYRFVIYHTPNWLLDWYLARQGSLQQQMADEFKREGIKDDDIVGVEVTWNNPYDLLPQDEREARRRPKLHRYMK